MAGRPTKYKAEYAEQARKYCLLGATDAQLAEFFEVNEDTIHEWKKVHIDFSESIKKGKQQADAEVASSLYQRALGYSHPDVDIKMYEGGIIETPLIKHYAPDTTAAIFWLKNRQRGNWRDKHEVDMNSTGKQTVIHEYSTIETKVPLKDSEEDIDDSRPNKEG